LNLKTGFSGSQGGDAHPKTPIAADCTGFGEGFWDFRGDMGSRDGFPGNGPYFRIFDGRQGIAVELAGATPCTLSFHCAVRVRIGGGDSKRLGLVLHFISLGPIAREAILEGIVRSKVLIC
jgi:hypothetical protein